MKLRTLAALALATSAVSFAAPASAADKMMGLRFEFGGSLATSGDFVNGRPNAGDVRIGYDLAGGFTPLLGLSYRTSTDNIYTENDDIVSGRGVTDIVINLEGRYYFRPHKKGISPFVFAGFDWHNVSVGIEGPKGTSGAAKDALDAEAAAEGDRMSAIGFNAGFGLEWLASKSFGVGGKWGVDFISSPTSVQKKGDEKDGDNGKHNSFGTAAQFYLTWRI